MCDCLSVVGQATSEESAGEQKFATVIQGYIKQIEELKWVEYGLWAQFYNVSLRCALFRVFLCKHMASEKAHFPLLTTCFQAFPLCARYLLSLYSIHDLGEWCPVVLVVAPLISLMDDQITKLKSNPTRTNCQDLIKNLCMTSGKILAKYLERIMHCFGTNSWQGLSMILGKILLISL